MKYTYYDFAQDSHSLLDKLYKDDKIYNAMCEIAHHACECYLKHLINEYYKPDQKELLFEKLDVLRLCDLGILYKYWQSITATIINTNITHKLDEINYISYHTNYPCEGCFFADESHIEIAMQATNLCRAFVNSELERLNS